MGKANIAANAATYKSTLPPTMPSLLLAAVVVAAVELACALSLPLVIVAALKLDPKFTLATPVLAPAPLTFPTAAQGVRVAASPVYELE